MPRQHAVSKSKESCGYKMGSKNLAAPTCWGTGHKAACLFPLGRAGSCFIVLLCLYSFSASYVVVNHICWLSGVILRLKLVRKEKKKNTKSNSGPIRYPLAKSLNACWLIDQVMDCLDCIGSAVDAA